MASEKSYLIKVPVFTTSSFVCSEDEIFGYTYQSMVDDIKSTIDGKFRPIHSNNRNKTKTSVISNVEYSEKTIGDRPCLLIRIAAFNTNINDGYFEDGQKYAIGKTSKIGTDSNYVLLYPIINGGTNNSKECFFLVLVYEDPYKDTGSVSRLARLLVNKTLNHPIQNIKTDLVLKELKSIGNIPELQVKYTGISFDEDDIDIQYKPYLTKTHLQKAKENTFKDVPFGLIENLVNEELDTSQYQKQRFCFIQGKKEYRITKQMIDEAQLEFQETAEKVFNASSAISQTELDEKVYNEDFIVEKLSGVLTNYLSNGEI